MIGIDVARHQISITGGPTIGRKIFSNIDDDISRCNFVTNLSICQWTFAIEFDTIFASIVYLTVSLFKKKIANYKSSWLILHEKRKNKSINYTSFTKNYNRSIYHPSIIKIINFCIFVIISIINYTHNIKFIIPFI